MNILYENQSLTRALNDPTPDELYLKTMRAAKADRFHQLTMQAAAYAQTTPMDIRVEQDDLQQGHIHLWAQRLHFSLRFLNDAKDRELFSTLFAEADEVMVTPQTEEGLLHLHVIFIL